MKYEVTVAKPPKKQHGGSNAKYPFDQMPVGGNLCFLIPLDEMPGSGIRGIRAAAFARGYRIKFERTDDGFRIWVTEKFK